MASLALWPLQLQVPDEVACLIEGMQEGAPESPRMVVSSSMTGELLVEEGRKTCEDEEEEGGA